MMNNHSWKHLSTRKVVGWFCDQIPGLAPESRCLLVENELMPLPLGGPDTSLFVGLYEDGQMLGTPLTIEVVRVKVGDSVASIPAVRLRSILHGQTFFQLSRSDGSDEGQLPYRLDAFFPLMGMMWVHYTPSEDWLSDYRWLLNEVSEDDFLLLCPALQLAS